MAASEGLRVKAEMIKAREERLRLMEGLPFLYGWKWYTWAREFFESDNKLNFICAANQISKSSTQIRKCIEWATNQEKWPRLWARAPIQFWYLYPTSSQASIEFETKWKLFLPRGEFKDHPLYGWEREVKNKEIFAIHFKSGVHVYFKSYAQDAIALQTGTCDAIFADEELPVHLYDELMMRLAAADGYFHMVFTATLGQDFWKEVIEERGTSRERLPSAAKWQVSMYDCRKYEDDSPSHWTDKRIATVKARCKNNQEILRRVYGRFVVDEGRKYPQYDATRNMKKNDSPVPEDWMIYAGVDPGSGGENHPAAITFVAVRPDFRYGRVFLGWRGDHIETDASDTLRKYIEMQGKMFTSGRYYDWADKDFDTISTRMGLPFQPADKGHQKGEEILNALFKNGMLDIDESEELEKLSWELSTLRQETPKRVAKDDFIDSLRYAVTRIPWDWSFITGETAEWEPRAAEKPKSPMEREIDERRGRALAQERAEQGIEEELEMWGNLYEP